jgi:hypothetical protein
MARLPEPASEADDNIEENISGLIHRAEAQLRSRADATQPNGPNHLNSTVQRVAGASVAEIDGLIRELQSLRDYLLQEAQRIQRELTEYTRLNQGAIESTRAVTETLIKVKPRPDRAPGMQ